MDHVTLAVLTLFFASALCINVETKLDFLDGRPSKPKVVEKVFVVEKSEAKKKSEGEVKLVCKEGGCNATSGDEHNTSEGKSKIGTDIVIEIKTTLGGSKVNVNNDEEEVSDVPIVLGYGGLGNSIHSDEHSYNSPPLFHTYNDVRNGNNGFIPSYGVPHFNAELSPPRPLLVSDDDYKSVRYNVDPPSGHYLPPPAPHYLPKPAVNYNPLGPNRVPKPDWKTPSPWSNRRHGYNFQRPYHKPTTHYPWTKCNCHHHNTDWRPTTSRPFVANPGTQINDKLAPLN